MFMNDMHLISLKNDNSRYAKMNVRLTVRLRNYQYLQIVELFIGAFHCMFITGYPTFQDVSPNNR